MITSVGVKVYIEIASNKDEENHFNPIISGVRKPYSGRGTQLWQEKCYPQLNCPIYIEIMLLRNSDGWYHHSTAKIRWNRLLQKLPISCNRSMHFSGLDSKESNLSAEIKFLATPNDEVLLGLILKKNRMEKCWTSQPRTFINWQRFSSTLETMKYFANVRFQQKVKDGFIFLFAICNAIVDFGVIMT